MNRPRTAVKAALLAAMKACPNGQPTGDYAVQIGYSGHEASKAANLLMRDGLVVWTQLGCGRVWTAVEHRLTMKTRCAAEIKARAAAAKARKRITNAAHDQKRRGRPDRLKKTQARYQWPDVTVYTPPAPLIRSVWELAEAVCA